MSFTPPELEGTPLARHPFARMATRSSRRGRQQVFLAGNTFDLSTRLSRLLTGNEIPAASVAALPAEDRADLLKLLNLGLIGFLS